MKSRILYLDSVQWRANDAHGKWHAGLRGASNELPLDGIDAWMEGCGRRQSVEVRLSAACAQSLTLPWSSSVPSISKVKALVCRGWITRGIDLSSHDIRILWPSYGKPVLSVAYPTALMQGLASQLTPHSLRSVQSDVFVLAGRHLARSRASRELLLYAEADGYSALHAEAGQLVGAEYLQPQGKGLDALPIWLKRKAMEYPGDGEIRWLSSDNKGQTGQQEVNA